MSLLRINQSLLASCRYVNKLPPSGIYQANNEICRRDDILLRPRRLNYHPCANTSHQQGRGGLKVSWFFGTRFDNRTKSQIQILIHK